MKRRLPEFGLPLLARELTDQSNRARHYVLRSLFAAAVSLLGFLYLRQLLMQDNLAPVQSRLSPGSVSLMSLGHGHELLSWVCNLELVGILVFLPAMTCGAIANEKERNTLSVLLTTRLGPMTIVLEKLLSRLILIFMLLFLSVPLLTFTYAMGGIGLEEMILQVLLLGSVSVLVATLSLACSTWCGSTVSAFFMTYAVGIALFIGSPCLALLAVPDNVTMHGTGLQITTMSAVALTLVAAPCFFFLSVACLVNRAFVTPRNFVLSFFRSLDAFFNRINVVTGNIVVVREKLQLPVDRPIAWRETAKKSLGTARYLVRVLVVLELPTIFLLEWESGSTLLGSGTGVAGELWFTVWCIAAVLIAVMCGSIISGEQTRQTLPILLTTPIPGKRIIDELFAGVDRLIRVLWIPFATIAGFEWWFHLGSQFAGQTTVLERLLCSLWQVAIFPYLIAWGTFYLGAKIRSPMWAVITCLMALTTVVAGPFLLEWLVQWTNPQLGWSQYLPWLSPAKIIIVNEQRHATYAITAINFLVYGGLLWCLRRFCRHQADRLLGRMESEQSAPPAGTPSAVREEMATA